ncbi:chorismate synthase, partial [Mycolicibacterium arseniciresistens]
MLRWTTAGESHGRALVAMLEGMVAGVHVTSEDIGAQLKRRRLGYGRGARMKFEQDQVTVLAGVRHGLTLGGPIAIEIGNTEWPKWETVMAADPVDPERLADLEDSARNAPLTRPRPGHADYAGMLKYGFDDARPVLER